MADAAAAAADGPPPRAADAAYWSDVSKRLPAGRDEEQKRERARLFSRFDPNGNGYLSLAEVDLGLKDAVGQQDLFESKQVVMRAFQAAKSAAKTKSAHGDDYVERQEFRLLLLFLRQYLELYVMFDAVDATGDGRIQIDEFTKAVPKLEGWSAGIDFTDAQKIFNEIDVDGGQNGYIRFDEFSQWALKKHLDLEADDETEEVPLPANNLASDNVAAHLEAKAAAEAAEGTAAVAADGPPPRAADAAYWSDVSKRLPAGRDEEQKRERARLFSRFDPNGNGYLSLAEVDLGLKDAVGQQDLFESKQVVMRAFQAAKSAAKTKSAHGDEYVERQEFRLLLLYLRQYLELYVMFDAVDATGDGRIQIDEFAKAMPKLERWGAGIDFTDAQKIFNEIDVDGGQNEFIRFDEFSQWALKNHLDLEADDETEEVPLPANNLASDNVAVHLDAKEAHPKTKTDTGSHKEDLVKHPSLDVVLATGEFEVAAAEADDAPSKKPAAATHAAQKEARPGVGGEKIPAAGVRCLEGVAISPAPRQPDTPYQEYLEAYRRYCAAAAAMPSQPAK